MDFVELCQAVVRRAGISGGSNTLPTTVVGQTGRMALVVDYVKEATMDIETAWNDWTFMRREVDFEIVADSPSFDPVSTHTDVERLNLLSMTARDDDNRNAVTINPWIDERIDRVISYPDPVATLPTAVSVDLGGVIHFNPPCDHDFILRCEVTIAPTVLAADADEPYIPVNYRDVIIHRALMYNYESEEAEYLRQASEIRYNDWMLRLEERFLPGNTYRQTQSAEAPLTIITQ